MDPAKSDEVVIVLVIEYRLFVFRRARVGSSALLRNDEMRDGEFVALQTAGQNAASLDVAVRVGLSQIQKTTHQHRRDDNLAHS